MTRETVKPESGGPWSKNGSTASGALGLHMSIGATCFTILTDVRIRTDVYTVPVDAAYLHAYLLSRYLCTSVGSVGHKRSRSLVTAPLPSRLSGVQKKKGGASHVTTEILADT